MRLVCILQDGQLAAAWKMLIFEGDRDVFWFEVCCSRGEVVRFEVWGFFDFTRLFADAFDTFSCVLSDAETPVLKEMLQAM